MFIKVKDKEELVNTLRSEIGENAVIHYNCENCDDEQVTYNDEVLEEIVNDFRDKGYIMVNYPCTNCGFITKFLSVDYIQGVEYNF